MGLGRRRASSREKVGPAEVKVFLDTHFVIWVLQRSSRLAAYPRLEACRPWGVSPVVLLEIQYLSEIGRLIAAHSQLRRVPLCTTDRVLRERHMYLVDELGRLT